MNLFWICVEYLSKNACPVTFEQTAHNRDPIDLCTLGNTQMQMNKTLRKDKYSENEIPERKKKKKDANNSCQVAYNFMSLVCV